MANHGDQLSAELAAYQLADSIRVFTRSLNSVVDGDSVDLEQVAAVLHVAFDGLASGMDAAALLAGGNVHQPPAEAWNRAVYDALNLRDHVGRAVPDDFDWGRLELDDSREAATDNASRPGFDQYAETVLQALQSRWPYGMNVGELQLETQLGRNTVYDALSALRASGHVSKAGHGRYSARSGKAERTLAGDAQPVLFERDAPEA